MSEYKVWKVSLQWRCHEKLAGGWHTALAVRSIESKTKDVITVLPSLHSGTSWQTTAAGCARGMQLTLLRGAAPRDGPMSAIGTAMGLKDRRPWLGPCAGPQSTTHIDLPCVPSAPIQPCSCHDGDRCCSLYEECVSCCLSPLHEPQTHLQRLYRGADR